MDSSVQSFVFVVCGAVSIANFSVFVRTVRLRVSPTDVSKHDMCVMTK